MVIKEPNLWQIRAYTCTIMPVYIYFAFLFCIFMNINEYVKIYGKISKLYTPEITEAYCAHIVPRLYLMGTNRSVRVS